MPLRAVCPECGATTTVEDGFSKRSVDCVQCGKQVPVVATGGPPPLPKKEDVDGEPGFEILDENEQLDDRPPVGRDLDDDDDDRPRPAVRSRDEDDEDEDDDDDRPVRSRSRDDDDEEDDFMPRRSNRLRAADDDDEEEDEEDERPTRRAASGRHDDEDEDDEEVEEDDDGDEDEEVEEDEEEEAPLRRRGSAVAVDDEEDEDEDDVDADDELDEDDEDVVADEADEDDDDDDAPRRRARRDYDDDEDDTDQPKSKKGLLILLGLMLLVLGGGGGAVGYFVLRDKDKDKTVAKNDDDQTPPDGQPKDPDTKGPDPKIPNPKSKLPKVPDPKSTTPKIDPNIPLPVSLLISPATIDGERKSIDLPDKLSDTCACGDGRYLILSCANQKKLLIFDVTISAVVKEISTEGKETRFTAGATKLLIADNTNRRIERYDLLRLEKDKESTYPFEGKIEEIALGAGSYGPALVVTNPAGPWPVEFLDVESLAKADVGWASTPPADLPRVTRFSAAANGSRWAGIPAQPNARGAVVITRAGKRVSAERVRNDMELGYVALSADGQTICSRLGGTPIAAAVARAPGGDSPDFVAPAVSGPFFVHVAQTKGASGIRAVVSTNTNNPPASVPRFDLPQPYQPKATMPPDRHVYFVPDARVVVVYPSGGTKLEVIKFDMNANLKGRAAFVTSTPSDLFRPGAYFTYRLRSTLASTNRSYQVTEPAGAVVTPAGVVAWKAPPNDKRESVTFRVSVSAGGMTATQSFTAYNAMAAAPISAPPPKSGDPKDPVVGGSSNIIPGAKLVHESAGRLPISPPEMKDPHIELGLPGPIRDACVAGGGRFIIFHCPTVKKLAIFDVNSLKIEHSITVNSDDILFAASMEKLLVIYPDEKVVLRYSLATFKLETDVSLEVRQRATAAAMGSGTAGPLILGGIPAQNNASKMALTFLDLETMKEIAIDKAEGDFKVSFGAAAHLRVSADGRSIGAWLAQLRPSGLQIARLEGNTIGGSYLAETVGHVTPGPDGQTMFTEKGMYTSKGQPTGKREAVVPSVHGNWYLTIAPAAKGPAGAQRVNVWQMGQDTPIAELADLPGFDGKRDPFERDNPTLALDRKLFLVPEAKILLVIPPAANKLHVYRIEAGKK